MKLRGVWVVALVGAAACGASTSPMPDLIGPVDLANPPVEDLAAQIKFMWEHPNEVMRRVSVARQLLPTLSWEPEKERFLSFYSDLLGHRLVKRAP